jgi:dihydropteroate synthase
MLWSLPRSSLDLSHRGLVMGIVNVTPDSFSDGGQYFDAARAVAHGLQMLAEGAAILDIGGESTRPGAVPVDEAEELRRVLPVIAGLRAAAPEALLSVDTFKPAVAKAAVAAGADVINDISGFRDPAMIEVAARCNAGLVMMHMQGEPRTMQVRPGYTDVVAEVQSFFTERLAALAAAGVASDRVVLDPGIGFGKALEHNLTLLRSLREVAVQSRPVLVGVSRKSMIGQVLGSSAMEDRLWPTVALTAYAREHGAQIVRVHEVRANAEAMRMVEAIHGTLSVKQ